MDPKKRVLIVEDDNIVRNSLERLLAEGDFEIESAGTAEEGLQKFSDLHHDLILTDLKLPGIDGIDMISRMRRVADTLPFIVLSAYDDGKDVLRALKMGAIDYCEKPFNAQKILDLASKHTGNDAYPYLEEGEPGGRYNGGLEDKMSDSSTKSPTPSNYLQSLNRLTRLIAPFVSLGRQGTGITHNLNGPLTGMMGHVELMKIKHPDLGNDLDIIMGLTKKLRDHIADIQSKFENETIREPQLINLNNVIRTELAFLQADLFFKHYIEREIDLARTLPSVRGVYADLALAFEELLINAIDTQRNQADAKVRIKTYSTEDSIHAEIEDNGPGFSDEALEKCFDPFWPEFKEHEDGRVQLGMGLYLAQRWLEPFGGSIEIENCEPRGARVKVSIPLKGE